MEPKRLRKILDLSRRLEGARKGELSSARKQQADALALLEQKKREERARLTELEDSGELAVYGLADQARLLEHAAAEVHKARAAHAATNDEVLLREQAAVEATRDVRKFEILFEREQEQHKRALKNAEQQTLDETRRAPRKELS
jgi:flagellar biosynthesis chaperone FliJ